MCLLVLWQLKKQVCGSSSLMLQFGSRCVKSGVVCWVQVLKVVFFWVEKWFCCLFFCQWNRVLLVGIIMVVMMQWVLVRKVVVGGCLLCSCIGLVLRVVWFIWWVRVKMLVCMCGSCLIENRFGVSVRCVFLVSIWVCRCVLMVVSSLLLMGLEVMVKWVQVSIGSISSCMLQFWFLCFSEVVLLLVLMVLIRMLQVFRLVLKR